jgi:hypothetical protein
MSGANRIAPPDAIAFGKHAPAPPAPGFRSIVPIGDVERVLRHALERQRQLGVTLALAGSASGVGRSAFE